MIQWRILAVNGGSVLFFGARIGYVGKPRAVARYTALEPAFCSELIERLGGYPVQVDISGDGLRERGLGSCSSKISWSPPQCGHFNFLPQIA